MRRILAQCSKELAQFRRDKLTVALAYVLPTVAIVLYGFATRLEAKNIPISVINYDVGILSREYIAALFQNGQLMPAPKESSPLESTPLQQSLPQLHQSAPGKENAMKSLDRGLAKAVVIIPPDFSRDIKSRRQSTVQVIVDATDVNNARVIKNSCLATTQYFLMSQKLFQEQRLIVPQIRLWFNPGRKESLFIAPGSIAVFLWIFPCLLATLAIAREKEQGTMLQLYASSISSLELIAGKALAYWLIGITQAIVLIASSTFLFDLSFVGNLAAYMWALLLYLACSVCFGLLGGSRVSSQSAAVQLVATAGFTTSLLLSGFLYPLRNISFPLDYLSAIIPARYFVEASRNFFVRGADFISQTHILFALGLAAALIFLGASRVLHRMQIGD